MMRRNIKKEILGSFIFLSLLNLFFFLVCIFYPIYSFSIIFIILSLFCMTLYFISRNMNLIILDKIYDLYYVIPVIFIGLLVNTNIYSELSIYDLDNILSKKLSKNDDGIYEIKDKKIVDSENNIIIDWHFFGNFIEDGKIELKDGKIGYKIQLEDKCVMKNNDELKYKTSLEKCESIDLIN